MSEQNPNQEQEQNQTPNPDVKTFTQDELNAIIQKEKGKAKESALKEFQTKLGDKSLDDILTTLTELQTEKEEKRKSELSEIEKLQEELKQAQLLKEESDKSLLTFKEQFNQERVRNAFIQKAREKNVAYIDAALKLADLSNIQINNNEIVGLDEVVDSLVAGNQFLLKQETTQPREIGGQNNPPLNKNNNKSNEQLLKEAADKARQSGRAEDKIAYVQLKKELGF